MKVLLNLSLIIVFTGIMASCGDSTDVVESGTYKGTIKEVEADKDEIYVTTEDDKVLELYFTEDTKLTRKGEPVDFSELEEGQKVEVEVEKKGKKLDPIRVDIQE